ncbi:TPA: hypothetical protein HA235_05970 [Candidatus Woesearchaeota archaeon]|nr:hypothetical protein [Candidatus Woesearchaeota archaeon]HIH32230.1 hypothetical protein [Candidatus Woesearchaeota archaeon]HIH54731.1 hypothetical protein [Candidatus Woesearchaeota archaeon]HIJ01448.1 hypothetical protein [Candidatus Woesearchaeota archaeon]HIJ14686.1 hypothetical protein [Candidatus Woesearchaeota archaeon]
MNQETLNYLLSRIRESYDDVKPKIHHIKNEITIDFIEVGDNKIFLLDNKYSEQKINHLYLSNPSSTFLLNDKIYGLTEIEHKKYHPYKDLEEKYYASTIKKFIISDITNYFARLQENHHEHFKPKSIITFYDPENIKLYNAELEKIFLDSKINSKGIRLYETAKEELKHMYAGKLISLDRQLKIEKGYLSSLH